MSPSLQPITTFFHSSASETSLSPASGRSFNQLYCRHSFSQPSSLPLRDSSCITALVVNAFNVKKYGAIGKGKHDSTELILLKNKKN
ncbi:hypothetical protein SUGI_0300150 [Cryptomeria japonica]|nr:hypothetical protein SUGI_0300150 [Cryptomeria japonica]